MSRRVGVGVGVIVIRDGRVLMVQRRHRGPGTWSFPGGYLDFGETPESCAVRETREETGVVIADPIYLAITNDHIDDERHNVTLWFEAKQSEGEARLNAPEELLAVEWFPCAALPAPLFVSTRNFVRGRTYPPSALRFRPPERPSPPHSSRG
jgi:8-oxo-dGTP diphosphatase